MKLDFKNETDLFSDSLLNELFSETVHLLKSNHTENEFRELSNKYNFLNLR